MKEEINCIVHLQWATSGPPNKDGLKGPLELGIVAHAFNRSN